MEEQLVEKTAAAVQRFRGWLDSYGEISWDHQSFYASKIGRAAKSLYYRKPLLGTLAVAPAVFCEAFVPSARRLFWKPQRFAIADAHYAMGFAFLGELHEQEKYNDRAVHFLEALEATRCRDYEDYCWGYPFDWETRTGILRAGTPMITTVPYVYEAFSQVYAIDQNPKWLAIMQSIADHVFKRYRDEAFGPNAASCAYTPTPEGPTGVINATAYRAFMLTKAAIELSRDEYLDVAQRNLNFVLATQQADGSWPYAVDGVRDFVDHFHTCFVLKSLAKIEKLTGSPECANAIDRGTKYYLENFFDADGLPLPFSRRPRLTVYRRELYDFAECINLAVLLNGRFPELDRVLPVVLNELVTRWQKPDGSFRTRQLFLGWDNVPMHRWAQSQLFRSLCFVLSESRGTIERT